jgi:DNA-binding GntR family transcriptional regulator
VTTVNRAVSLLRDRVLVIGRPGLGVFVVEATAI